MIFIKLESSTSQKQSNIMYKINSRVDCNLMPLKIFKCLFPESTIGSLHTKSFAILNKYNNSNIQQLGMCLVWLRHKDKVVRCRVLVIPVDGPVLLGILKDQQQTGRKIYSQTRQAAGASENKTNTANISNEKKIHNGFSNVFIVICCFNDMFKLQVSRIAQKGSLYPARASRRGVRYAAKTTNDSFHLTLMKHLNGAAAMSWSIR